MATGKGMAMVSMPSDLAVPADPVVDGLVVEVEVAGGGVRRLDHLGADGVVARRRLRLRAAPGGGESSHMTTISAIRTVLRMLPSIEGGS